MKKINILCYILLAALLVTSCQDDDHELGKTLDRSAINFEVFQDYSIDEGGNTVILRNNTPGTIPIWDFGTGRSNRQQDTIRFAFAGEYEIKLSVTTAGGVVEMEPVTVTVTQDNLNYVNHQLWTYLTGGVGNSKTWILDNGKYGLGIGPMSYADPGREQNFEDYVLNWEPDNVGQTENDMAAEMTFNLIGGPFLQTHKPNEPTTEESGTFFLNTDSHTLSTTDATIIRVAGFIPNAENWNNSLKILELNENQLRIAILRTNSEGAWWYVFNYVSKEYAENYVPQFVPDPNFNHGDQMLMLAGNSATTWKMSTASPFNWTNLEGGFLNNWNSIADYPDWTGYDAGAVANIDGVRLTFYKTGDVVLVQDDGTQQRGSFSLLAPKNLITFEGIVPSIYISGGWVTATTTSHSQDEAGNVITGENQWKIVRIRTVSGVVTEVWFGKRDPGKKEYMVYHFELESGMPDVKTEMIKALTGKATGASSRTFKIDLNWPVDWTNLLGEGWTVAGTQDGWYWNPDIAASVANQTLTFSQTDGVVTVTKKDENGVISTSPVEINGDTRTLTITDTHIIQFGAGSWLPTSGPTYHWARGEYDKVPTEGMWIGVKTGDNEITAYHYILTK